METTQKKITNINNVINLLRSISNIYGIKYFLVI
jgi:hypothetical protein